MTKSPKESRMKRPSRFADRYGSWALVAGASEGLGAAFARSLASHGMNLVLIARRKNMLDALANEYRRLYHIEVLCLEIDLSMPDFLAKLQSSLSGLEVGMVVYNAAFAPVGNFDTLDLADLLRVVQVNVAGPVALVRSLLPAMIGRQRGALILMSSLAGNQGLPRLATYAASKAFNTVLAEGLWRELKGRGIDVLVCCAGAVRTPGFAKTAGSDAPGTMNADLVVERTLQALGRGPRVIPGFVNQVANWVLSRIVPRRVAIGIMAGSTKDLAAAAGRQKETGAS
jgi:short-subunit dehydrogenase